MAKLTVPQVLVLVDLSELTSTTPYSLASSPIVFRSLEKKGLIALIHWNASSSHSAYKITPAGRAALQGWAG